MKIIRKRIWEILEISKKNDHYSQIFDYFISIIISINVIAIIVETEKEIYQNYKIYFNGLEILSIIIFSLEYVLRLWSCVESESYSHPFWGRLKYIFSFLAIIDLIVIAPFFFNFIISDTRILRILRFLRLLRITKHFRHSQTFHRLLYTIHKKKSELISSLVLMLSLLLICSTGVYYVEYETQPEKFSSIPASMWWAVATLTTVGYGDIYPITPLGKLFGAISAIFGIGLFALPAGLLASGFSESSENYQKICPHCGKTIIM